jgi:hypothetical protein
VIIIAHLNIPEVASQFQVALLLAEGSMLYGLQHQNLLPVLAVALPKPRGPPMLVYPLMGHGNLKRFSLFFTSEYFINPFSKIKVFAKLPATRKQRKLEK